MAKPEVDVQNRLKGDYLWVNSASCLWGANLFALGTMLPLA